MSPLIQGHLTYVNSLRDFMLTHEYDPGINKLRKFLQSYFFQNSVLILVIYWDFLIVQ